MNNGGAIYVHSGSSLTIEDCIFEPLSESPHQAKSGGTIYAVSMTLLTMRNCTINASRAENSGNGHGGAISAYGCASVVIEDSVISNNSSDNDGGGCCFFTNDIEQVTNPRLVRWAGPSLAREPEAYQSASKAARSVRGGRGCAHEWNQEHRQGSCQQRRHGSAVLASGICRTNEGRDTTQGGAPATS
ncbi:MAG: hypothetical protein BroJett003_03510 [Planctomycetota bacterium]|nr:MAG: hypothetical protein BroJett003_03510 [Planctomycetota bacterium]